jgi:3-phenylpropionate/cinnamic acid dioxygenase small subunit
VTIAHLRWWMPMLDIQTKAPGELVTWHEINQFYIREARLLDDLKFSEWVELFTDDVSYWMPIVSNRVGRDVGKELTGRTELSHFDEDKTSLRNRVRRFATGMAWAETPPGRTRHFVSNVEVATSEDSISLTTRSSFLIWRSHLETDQEIFSGCRHDMLRRENDTYRIAQRKIVLDHSVLTQKSLGVFF